LHFHGFQSLVTGIRLNGKEVAQAAAPSHQAVNWAMNKSTGELVITIPPSADRTLKVEFAAKPDSKCEQNC